MHVGFLGGAVSRLGGGLFEAQVALSAALRSRGCGVTAFGTSDQFSDQDKSRWGGMQALAFPAVSLAGFAWSASMRDAVMKSSVDVLHLHTLWTYSSIIAQDWLRRNKKPYLVTPHGMLDDWAIRNSGIKKKIALQLFERKTLQRAACINAHTAKELEDVRRLGITTPVVVIPNGVVIPTLDEEYSKGSEKKKMLFIGRLHPKKGLPLLIDAWAEICQKMRREGWQLLIAGWDQNGHQQELVSRCNELGVRSESLDAGDRGFVNIGEGVDVAFIGPVFGNAKHRLMQQVDAFVLSSLSEGLPIAVLEAWSYQVPTLITSRCNLPESAELQIAYVVEPTRQSLSEGLMQLIELPSKRLKEMGIRAREVAKDRYSWDNVAQQLAEVYEWASGTAVQPSFMER